MIDITLDDALLQPFIDRIANYIVIPGLADVAVKHSAGSPNPMLQCEIDFYSALKKDPKALLRKKPRELENQFDTWLAGHEAYVVFAAGSLLKIEHHIAGSTHLPGYRLQWAIHEKTVKAKKNAKSCTCHFCLVSARAAKVFSWPKFTKKDSTNLYSAANFVRAVAFVVCPYCSRNYISPIQDAAAEIYRPDLDHFLAQSIYPYFALCPYNLVPSCAACNCRIKGDADFLKNGYFHPYADTVPESLFSLDGAPIYTGEKIDASSVRIKLNTASCAKSKKSVEFFKLTTAYSIHAEEIANFVATFRAFPDKLIEERATELRVDPAILKLMLHRSVAADKSEFKTRPLGKLYRDLYLFAHK